ncbi:MAG: hypothetical protein ACQESR_06950 [Planctomycetota bacterium]
MGIPSALTRSTLCSGLAVLLFCVAGSVSRACDTPVYRYAMYRWYPAPYEVYCFHEGEMDEAAKQMETAIDEAVTSEKAPSNVRFIPVDLAEDEELKGVPPDVKEAWEEQEEATIPQFLVSSPVGGHLYKGQLSADQLPEMIDSPMRQRVGDEIKKGRAGVYVLLKGEDEKANAAAEKTLQGVVDDVASGKIELYTMPPAYGAYGPPAGDEPGEAESEAESKEPEDEGPQLSIGLLTLARDNPKEKWFIDTLLAMEPDLRESKEPIVFMIYGRGRALFSCLGEGIRRDNLIMDVEFITGACSCTVKDMNPGVDLLMSYNWDAAAETLYRQHGLEEGSPYGAGGAAPEEYPELMVPSGGEVDSEEESGDGDSSATAEASGSESGDAEEDDADDDTGASDTTMLAQADAPTTPGGESSETTAGGESEAASKSTEDAKSADEAQEGTAPDNESVSGTEVAANMPAATSQQPQADSDSDPSSFKGILWIGGGLLGVLVVLFGITFVVLRPK